MRLQTLDMRPRDHRDQTVTAVEGHPAVRLVRMVADGEIGRVGRYGQTDWQTLADIGRLAQGRSINHRADDDDADMVVCRLQLTIFTFSHDPALDLLT